MQFKYLSKNKNQNPLILIYFNINKQKVAQTI